MVHEFPFEVVYDYFAKGAVEANLSCEFQPVIAFVKAADDEIKDVMIMPESMVALAMMTGKPDEVMQKLLEICMEKIGDTPTCVVIVAPGFQGSYKGKNFAEEVKKITEKAEAGEGKDTRCIAIMIHRPECIRMGSMPIEDGKPLQYQPMKKHTVSAFTKADLPPANAPLH